MAVGGAEREWGEEDEKGRWPGGASSSSSCGYSPAPLTALVVNSKTRGFFLMINGGTSS